MSKENDYIQLPPLRRDTDLKVVMALWEYVKMPEESRQKVLAFLDESEKNNPSGELPPLDYLQSLPVEDINDFDKVINIIIYVDKIKVVNTSKGDKMAFLSGSDELSTVDIVLFPKTYEKYNDLSHGDIILIKGRVEKRFDKYQIVVNEIATL